MSDNSWHNKGYGDYFQSLENQLADKVKKQKNKNDTNNHSDTSVLRNEKTAVKSKKRGIYKVFRLRKSVLVLFAAIILTVTAITLLSSGKGKDKANPAPARNDIKTEVKDEKIPKIEYSFAEGISDIPAKNDAKNAIIINKNTNTVVAARNPHEKAYPASTTKLMTLLVASENIKSLDDKFTMTLEITDPLFVEGASVAGFLNGEEISVKDLMYGTMLPSGADAAVGLAIMSAGSEEKFVGLMNKKAEELGLENTHFSNPTGLHSVENYTTAYDMAIILGAVLQNDFCRQIISTYRYTTAETPQNPNGITLSNTIFEYMYGNEPETATILGGKTGFVNESGYCIASYGKCNENGNEYIVVTLGNSSRWPAFHGQIDLYKEFAK